MTSLEPLNPAYLELQPGLSSPVDPRFVWSSLPATKGVNWYRHRREGGAPLTGAASFYFSGLTWFCGAQNQAWFPVLGALMESRLLFQRVFVLMCYAALVVSNSLPMDPMDCSLPASSVHGISQARILEWGAISSSRGSSWPRNRTLVSYISCIGRQGFVFLFFFF